VVSTLESAPVREAEFFIAELRARKLHLGALVLNKVLPASLLDTRATGVARRLEERADEVAAEVAPAIDAEPGNTARVLREVGASFLNFQVVAQREAETRAELGATPEVVAAAPYLDSDVFDLGGLVKLGEAIWR